MTIDRERLLAALRASGDRGLTLVGLARELELPRASQTRLQHMMQQWLREGLVTKQGRRFRATQSGAQRSRAAAGSRTGLLRINALGRASVLLDETQERPQTPGRPLPVYPEDLADAIDGDRVAVEVMHRRTRNCARVVRVIEHSRQFVTGTIEGPPWRLRPDDDRLSCPVIVRTGAGGTSTPTLETWAAATPPPVVAARILRYPHGPDAPMLVEVVKDLGAREELATEVARVMIEQGLPQGFPDDVAAEAAAVPHHVRDADLIDRVDLRDRSFVTIDPESARDHDDAVAIEPGPHGTTRVWVAIADVSYYVPEGSALDREAQSRSCSIYLPDQCLPMLPPELSSGICSLVPNRDRLAMVVRLDLDDNGRTVASECMAAVIHSRARLTYGGVAAALRGDHDQRAVASAQHAEQLLQLRRVARSLTTFRTRRGSLDLDLSEPELVRDDHDHAVIRDIIPGRRDPAVRNAYKLIEELMLAANEAVAERFRKLQQPTVWRVHEAPDDEALEKLAAWLGSYGVRVDVDRLIDPQRQHKAMQQLLRSVNEHRAAQPLTYLVLRSLKQACYRAHHDGHFALASPAYLHFTSPIRRYPDLVVHRLLKQQLHAEGHPAGSTGLGLIEPNVETLQRVASMASTRERSVMDVERRVQAIYAAHVARQHLGEELEGSVVGIASFAFFVRLDQPWIEGMVLLETLPEAMEYDADHQCLVNMRRGGPRVELGDRVRVRLAAASLLRQRVELELLEIDGLPIAAPKVPRRGRRPATRARQESVRKQGEHGGKSRRSRQRWT